jgi:hypothetical protein
MGWSLVRMSDDRTVKKVFLGKPAGRRKAGRPKLKWLDCIENDLKSLGVKRWKKKAEDRSVWAIILKEALVKLYGPYASEEEYKETTLGTKAMNGVHLLLCSEKSRDLWSTVGYPSGMHSR